MGQRDRDLYNNPRLLAKNLLDDEWVGVDIGGKARIDKFETGQEGDYTTACDENARHSIATIDESFGADEYGKNAVAFNERDISLKRCQLLDVLPLAIVAIDALLKGLTDVLGAGIDHILDLISGHIERHIFDGAIQVRCNKLVCRVVVLPKFEQICALNLLGVVFRLAVCSLILVTHGILKEPRVILPLVQRWSSKAILFHEPVIIALPVIIIRVVLIKTSELALLIDAM